MGQLIFKFIFIKNEKNKKIRKILKSRLCYAVHYVKKHVKKYVKKQRHYFANKGLTSQGYDFTSGHVWV